MFLKFNLPIRINLKTLEKENLNNAFINFNYRKYNCFLKLKTGMGIKEYPEKEKIIYTRQYYGISIIIEDDSNKNIEHFVKKQSMKQILELINLFSNRCLSIFRNYGNLTKVREFSLQLEMANKEQFECFFMMLDTKISINNSAYENILEYWGFKIDLGKEWISISLQGSYFNVYNEEYLDYNAWLDIKNALENNLEITEELYFFVNSLEHIRNNNIRLAVIETVISLEIAVSKYLKNYLMYKHIPNDRIGNLINSKIGITSMVSVLLNLTIEEKLMKIIKVDEVLKLITLRNDIIHKNKKIPIKSSEQEEIISQITATQSLCLLLFSFFNKRIKIKTLLQNTQKSYGIENIEVICIPRTSYFQLKVYLKEYSNELIEKINFSIISSLENYRSFEKLYNKNEHLTIHYRFDKKIIAKFLNGKTVYLNQ